MVSVGPRAPSKAEFSQELSKNEIEEKGGRECSIPRGMSTRAGWPIFGASEKMGWSLDILWPPAMSSCMT
jgi:hypothetical protein